MSQTLSKIPRGFRLYAAADASVRRTIEDRAMSVFHGWCYEEVITPTLDYYALFEAGMGSAEARRSFRFSEGEGELLALRPDVTSAIARAAATLFAPDERPLRLCYSATVFRQFAQSHVDWLRETKQIGCELLGINSEAADMEVLAIVAEILSRLDLKDQFVITLNDVEIFNGIADNLSLDNPARNELRRLMDIRAAADLESFLKPYATAQECSAFADLVQLSGKVEIFDQARAVITNMRSRAALDRLQRLWRVIDAAGMSNAFEVDLGNVARLDYYTGLTFTTYVAGAGARIGSGGRYDNLTANFGKREPAIGFVLDLDALAELLRNVTTTIEDDARSISAANGNVSAQFTRALELRARGEKVRIEPAK